MIAQRDGARESPCHARSGQRGLPSRPRCPMLGARYATRCATRCATWGLLAAALSTIGCAARAVPATSAPEPDRREVTPPPPPDPKLTRGLAEMARHERAGD